MLRLAVVDSLVASLCLVPLAAQHAGRLPRPAAAPAATVDVARRDAAGSVRGRDGQTWPGASVVLYAPPVQPLPELAPADEVMVQTDERGRFRAALLPGRPYAARAQLGGGTDAVRVTDIVREVLAEQTVMLVEAAEQPMEVEVRLHGLALWQGVAGIELQVVDSLGRTQPLAVGAEGKTRLAPSLGASGAVVLALPDGTSVSCWLSLLPSAREARRASWAQRAAEAGKRPVADGLPDLAKEPAPELAVENVFLALPRRAKLTVRSSQAKAPVAGAAVLSRALRTDGKPIATTDATGQATLVFAQPVDELGRPSASPETMFWFWVVAKGHAVRRCGWRTSAGATDLVQIDAEAATRGQYPDLDVELAPELPLVGEVRGTSTLPADGLRLLCERQVRLEYGPGSWGTALTTELVTAGAGGQWRLGGIAPGASGLRAFLVLTRTEIARLFPGASLVDDAFSLVEVELPSGTVAADAKLEGKPLDLASLSLAEILVRDPDGSPAAFARLSTGSGGRGGNETLLRADRRGRCRLLLSKASPTWLFQSEAGYAIHDFAPQPGHAEQELTLQPLAVVRGVVVDTDGKPVAGARVLRRRTRSTGGMDPRARLLEQINQRTGLSTTTSDDGRFELRLALVEGRSYGFAATKTIGKDSLTTPDADLVWVSRESILDATLPLPAARRAAPAAAAVPAAPAATSPAPSPDSSELRVTSIPKGASDRRLDIPERSPLVGTVRGKDGAPWRGATVAFHARSPLGLRELCAEDTVEVVTDERGRFKVELLSGRGYAALAVERGEGAARVSSLVLDVAAGPSLHLVEAAEQPMAVELRVVGLEAWKEHGLTLEVEDALGRRRAVALDTPGLRLPPRLGPSATVRLATPATGVLLGPVVPLLRSERQPARQQLETQRVAPGGVGEPFAGLPDLSPEELPPLEIERMVLGPPQRVRVKVVDEEAKQPIAGARLRWGSMWDDGTTTRPAVVAGADGVADLVVARQIDAFGRRVVYEQITFHATAEGRAAGLGGWSASENGWSMQPLRDESLVDGVASLEIVLAKGRSWTGRVELPAHVAAAGLDTGSLRLSVQSQGRFKVGDRSYVGYWRNELLAPDAAGLFQVLGLQASNDTTRLTLLVPQRVVAAVTGVPFPATHAALPVALAATIDLAALEPIDFVVVQPDGTPAAGARVHCSPRPEGIAIPKQLLPVTFTDPRGRARLVAGAKTPLLFVADAEGYACHEPQLGEAAARVELRLRKCPTIEGRVVDADDVPVAGARIYHTGLMRSTSNPFQNLVLDANAALLKASTGEDGTFRLRFVPVAGTVLGINASRLVGSQTVYGATLQVEQDSIAGAEIVLPFSQKTAGNVIGK